MGEFEAGALKELIGDIKLLRSDMAWVRRKVDEQAVNVKDLDERVRDLEQAITRIEAKQKPGVSWPVVVTIVIAITTAVLAIADRLYINQGGL